jgi:toxin ParE1/3/4
VQSLRLPALPMRAILTVCVTASGNVTRDKSKPIIRRAQADLDIQEAIEFYLNEGAESAALKFVTASEQAIKRIGEHPAIGSLRYAHELDLPNLRCWPVTGFQYLLFYIEQPDYVDLWRVLHTRRDIPVWMQSPT